MARRAAQSWRRSWRESCPNTLRLEFFSKHDYRFETIEQAQVALQRIVTAGGEGLVGAGQVGAQVFDGGGGQGQVHRQHVGDPLEFGLLPVDLHFLRQGQRFGGNLQAHVAQRHALAGQPVALGDFVGAKVVFFGEVHLGKLAAHQAHFASAANAHPAAGGNQIHAGLLDGG